MEKTMDKIVQVAKARGFVYPGSEIYGGLANTWDYGNLGVELKNNVKRAWWKKFIQENPYNVGVDCAILMNPQTWVASGHLGGFSDPLMDCKECHERFRADKIIEDFAQDNDIGFTFFMRFCLHDCYTLVPAFPFPARALLLRPHSSVHKQYRNFNLLSIDYGSRPRLRPRLTQGRSALPWKP